jgi:nitrate reductase gamma subunit
MTLFLVFPFTRLVHVWSGFGTLAYLVRPYQVVRTRRPLTPAHPSPASVGTQGSPALGELVLEPGKTA